MSRENIYSCLEVLLFMSQIYRYYGRCEVGETYKLNIPDSVFSDPRGPPLNQTDQIQYFKDTKVIDQYPINDILIIGKKELISERFNIRGNPNKSYKIGGAARFPKQLEAVTDVINPGITVHFVSALDLIDEQSHIYLLTTEQFDTLRDEGWRPAQVIDEDRINNRSYGNGNSFSRDVHPAKVDTSDSIPEPIVSSTEVKVDILGSTEDGGVPHLHCECKVCTQARENPSKVKSPNSLLVSSVTSESKIMFEATPDMRYQVRHVPDAVCLSHDFGGHISGLFSFGSEIINASRIPVYCSEALAELIRTDGLFNRLIDENNITVNPIESGETKEIENILIDFHTVDYPPGKSSSLAYKIRGSHKTLSYIPKVSSLKESKRLINMINDSDITILDGLYWAQEDETRSGGVPTREIPNLMDFFDNRDMDTEIIFTNLNHTNRALHHKDKLDGMKARGYDICSNTDTLYL